MSNIYLLYLTHFTQHVRTQPHIFIYCLYTKNMYLYIMKLISYVECNDKPNIYSNKKKTLKENYKKYLSQNTNTLIRLERYYLRK